MATTSLNTESAKSSVFDNTNATGFIPSRWTLARKLVFLSIVLVSVCFSVLTLLSVNAVREHMLNLAVQNYSEINRLLAMQSSGAIRWNKATQVEALFLEKSSEENSTLHAMRVFSIKNDERSLFSELDIESWSDSEAEELMSEHGLEGTDQPKVFTTDTYIITVTPVISAKKNQLVGTLVSAWSTENIKHNVSGTTRDLIMIVLASIVALSVVLGVAITRVVGARIRQSVNAVTRIADGNFDEVEEIHSRDELGELAYALNTVQQSLLAADDSERKANEFGRIKQALDCASSATLLVDAEKQIVYLNKAARGLFDVNCSAFRDAGIELPNPDKLIGQNLSVFEKIPEISMHAIDRLIGDQIVEAKISDCTLQINMSTVINDEGKRMGTVLEWLDRSREINAEAEVKSMVEAASRGDFTHRIDVASMEGFCAQIGSLLNEQAEIFEMGLNDTLRVIKALEHGDFSVQIEKEYKGVFNELKMSCNATAATLTETVNEIRLTSEGVRNSASDISNGNMELSTRTEKQASNLEETAAAMEQINSIVQQSADDTRHVSKLVEQAKSLAVKGGMVSGDAVRAMGEISESSKKISIIIGVINDIAFQTNLLALNAAVEAARAGEQGRGFSVVASEVGNLAGRSAIAAKEIKALIEDSVLRVSEGEHLVGESGSLLERIVTSVNDVSKIASDMATARDEQTNGIAQINSAIVLLDETTQRNAALAEQTAAASETLGEQASNLDELVGFFRAKEDSDQEYYHLQKPA